MRGSAAWVVIAAFASLLVACGGGGDTSPAGSSQSPGTGMLNRPADLGTDTFDDQVLLRACTDATCSQPLMGSPNRISTQYVIGNVVFGPNGYTLDLVARFSTARTPSDPGRPCRSKSPCRRRRSCESSRGTPSRATPSRDSCTARTALSPVLS